MASFTLLRLYAIDWLHIDYIIHEVLGYGYDISHEKKCNLIVDVIDFILDKNLDYDYNKWSRFHKIIFKLSI